MNNSAFCELYATQLFIPGHLYELAREYINRTDTYNRAVCSSIKDDVPIPRTVEEVELINKYAEDLISELAGRHVDGYNSQDIQDVVKLLKRTKKQ